MNVTDWRDAAASAVESSVRRAAAGGWRRCTVNDGAGNQCMYGDAHTVDHKLVPNCSRCGVWAARDGSTLCARCGSGSASAPASVTGDSVAAGAGADGAAEARTLDSSPPPVSDTGGGGTGHRYGPTGA